MSERGSYTIELSLVISICLMVIGLLIFRLGQAFETVAEQAFEPARYQEAFWDKIDQLRIEKIMKEKR